MDESRQNMQLFLSKPDFNEPENDYVKKLEEIDEYLDKLKKIASSGCSSEVLNLVLNSMTSLAKVLSTMSSSKKRPFESI
ncbi:pyrophosphate--fructose 6-phosphate 1-phosphotransferase subunit alpha 2-like [Impatiens glandulifera]|uniref:pyrophosphate--fructose 6-phosphate 1-phosphotransferase subunit alpha 2-like n=1 Tax=Impatiens glandulifera TaxID=253017 RepID=UPI001FB0E793|nr:pyrophosphate--fructose 6-phosphate 1-phosphotransferase subunit alpha 2-like [Impatiens glandulifera]